MSILKGSGPGGGASGEGCEVGGEGPAQKNVFNFLPSPAKKKYKTIISEKLKIAKKKSFMQKVSARSIPIYAANLATFEESRFFGRPKSIF